MRINGKKEENRNDTWKESFACDPSTGMTCLDLSAGSLILKSAFIWLNTGP